MASIQIGDRHVELTDEVLRNGAHVIASKGGSHDDRVVLCYWPESPQQFVTWVVNADGSSFWGHYFETLTDAERDFRRRH